MKSVLYVVMTIMVVLGLAYLTKYMNSIPVVWQDISGEVCHCAVAGDYTPSMHSCIGIDMQHGKYELIRVRHCPETSQRHSHEAK